MPTASQRSATPSELVILYELSLAAGGELDLGETCRKFLDLLKARFGLDYAAVWVRRELLPGASRLSARERDGLGLAYASPAGQASTSVISALHPLVQLSEDAPWTLVPAADPAFGKLVMEREVDGGAYVVYRLRDVGLLKLHASAARSQPSAARVELLQDVIERFAAAVEVSLDHQLSIEEQRRHRLADRRLLREQRRASVGRLASGVAQRFAALTSTILERARPLRGREDACRAAVDWIVDSAQRAQHLCRQLAEIAGPQADPSGWSETARSDVQAAVDRAVERASRELPDGVRVVRELHGALPEVELDRARFGEALSSLLTYAVEASEPGGGVVTVRTMLEHVRPSDFAHYPFGALKVAGDYVCVEVEDVGAGLDEEARAALFEPFSGRRGGVQDLGMAAALGVVQRHGGAVAVESAPGAGTCVRVLLPAGRAARAEGRSRARAQR